MRGVVCQLTYANSRLQKLCEKHAVAQQKFGSAGAKKLGLRVKELQPAPTPEELQKGPGRWHPIVYDWPGCLSGRLHGGSTIIVRHVVHDDGHPGWHVECLGDCYKH